MAFSVRIGERQVIGSGQLVLGAHEREVTFSVDEVDCRLTFTPIDAAGPFQVRFDRRDATHLDLETRGRFPAGQVSWTYQGLLQQGGREIDLDLSVFSENEGGDSIRRIGYTFTSRAPGLNGMLDPTSPLAAPRAAGSAPPPIQVRPT